MNQHKLRVLCEVVERQSLTLAAQQLTVSQPVVSAHMRDLETFFGAKLLFQQGRRMLPTEAGQVVYQYALDLLRQTEETVKAVHALEVGDAGRIVVGANMGPGTYTLPPRLTAFRRRHPLVDISLLISDSTTVCQQTQRGTYDFAVIAVLDPPPGLHAEVLSQEPLVLFAHPSHPLASHRTVKLQALEALDFVCSPTGDTRRRVIDTRLHELGLVNRRLVMTLGHPEAIKQAVRDGVGVAMLYRSSVQRDLDSGDLIEVSIEGHQFTHPFYLIHSHNKHFSPVQTAMLDFLRGGATV